MEREAYKITRYIHNNFTQSKDIIKSIVNGKKRDFSADCESLAKSLETAKVQGTENIPLTPEPLIIACGHPDLVDLALGTANITYALNQTRQKNNVPSNIRWVVAKNIVSREKNAVFNKKVLYPAINIALEQIHKVYNFVPVPIYDNNKNLKKQKLKRFKALITARNYLKSGKFRTLGIFPEGDFHQEGKLLDFYSGIGILCKNLSRQNVSVLPTIIFRDDKNKLNIKFGTTISPDSKSTYEEITKSIHNSISQLQRTK